MSEGGPLVVSAPHTVAGVLGVAALSGDEALSAVGMAQYLALAGEADRAVERLEGVSLELMQAREAFDGSGSLERAASRRLAVLTSSLVRRVWEAGELVRGMGRVTTALARGLVLDTRLQALAAEARLRGAERDSALVRALEAERRARIAVAGLAHWRADVAAFRWHRLVSRILARQTLETANVRLATMRSRVYRTRQLARMLRKRLDAQQQLWAVAAAADREGMLEGARVAAQRCEEELGSTAEAHETAGAVLKVALGRTTPDAVPTHVLPRSVAAAIVQQVRAALAVPGADQGARTTATRATQTDPVALAVLDRAARAAGGAATGRNASGAADADHDAAEGRSRSSSPRTRRSSELTATPRRETRAPRDGGRRASASASSPSPARPAPPQGPHPPADAAPADAPGDAREGGAPLGRGDASTQSLATMNTEHEVERMWERELAKDAEQARQRRDKDEADKEDWKAREETRVQYAARSAIAHVLRWVEQHVGAVTIDGLRAVASPTMHLILERAAGMPGEDWVQGVLKDVSVGARELPGAAAGAGTGTGGVSRTQALRRRLLARALAVARFVGSAKRHVATDSGLTVTKPGSSPRRPITPRATNGTDAAANGPANDAAAAATRKSRDETRSAALGTTGGGSGAGPPRRIPRPPPPPRRETHGGAGGKAAGSARPAPSDSARPAPSDSARPAPSDGATTQVPIMLSRPRGGAAAAATAARRGSDGGGGGRRGSALSATAAAAATADAAGRGSQGVADATGIGVPFPTGVGGAGSAATASVAGATGRVLGEEEEERRSVDDDVFRVETAADGRRGASAQEGSRRSPGRRTSLPHEPLATGRSRSLSPSGQRRSSMPSGVLERRGSTSGAAWTVVSPTIAKYLAEQQQGHRRHESPGSQPPRQRTDSSPGSHTSASVSRLPDGPSAVVRDPVRRQRRMSVQDRLDEVARNVDALASQVLHDHIREHEHIREPQRDQQERDRILQQRPQRGAREPLVRMGRRASAPGVMGEETDVSVRALLSEKRAWAKKTAELLRAREAELRSLMQKREGALMAQLHLLHRQQQQQQQHEHEQLRVPDAAAAGIPRKDLVLFDRDPDGDRDGRDDHEALPRPLHVARAPAVRQVHWIASLPSWARDAQQAPRADAADGSAAFAAASSPARSPAVAAAEAALAARRSPAPAARAARGASGALGDMISDAAAAPRTPRGSNASESKGSDGPRRARSLSPAQRAAGVHLRTPRRSQADQAALEESIHRPDSSAPRRPGDAFPVVVVDLNQALHAMLPPAPLPPAPKLPETTHDAEDAPRSPLHRDPLLSPPPAPSATLASPPVAAPFRPAHVDGPRADSLIEAVLRGDVRALQALLAAATGVLQHVPREQDATVVLVDQARAHADADAQPPGIVVLQVPWILRPSFGQIY